MLLELTIHNIALIESLRIEFAQGFNVLTGETGAGKSIVVDCLNLSLGGRADRDMLRTGADRGGVEALFDISENESARKMAEEIGVDAAEGMVCVSRELSRSGRNICRIAGVPMPLSTLKQFTSHLIDIHGQHEHQALLNPARHADYLDAFGGEAHAAKMNTVRVAHAMRSSAASKLKALLRDASERERLTDMLRYQVQEISAAKLKNGEEEKLEKKLNMLENAEKVQSAVETAYALTYAGMDGMSAQESLLRANEAMSGIAGLDSRFAKIADDLRGLYYSAQEVGSELRSIREELSFDPALLEKINARLELISRLERKYGATEAEVIAYGKDAKARLEAIESGDEEIARLKREFKTRDAELRGACEQLTASRKAIAERLEREIVEQLRDLGMQKTRFRVDIRPLEKPTANGADLIEFMISPNPGEPLRPLAEIASGGELSRIMLALKTISMSQGGVDSMIFDEIDTGVSGRMAQVVGEKMVRIASEKQVICVTHLPQIAALGDTQFLVEKTVSDDRTQTGVVRLDAQGRIRELSRIVGGGRNSESSLAHAAHMLEDAAQVRSEIRK